MFLKIHHPLCAGEQWCQWRCGGTPKSGSAASLICQPLDILQYTSRYGLHLDPITRCCKFHVGVDLRCHEAVVYSMLPGTVKTVHWSNKGYGNYVVVTSGDLEFLYAHLSGIIVRKGQN